MGQCLMPKDIEFDMCVYINIRLVFQTITSTHGCYVYYVYNSDNKYKRIQFESKTRASLMTLLPH